MPEIVIQVSLKFIHTLELSDYQLRSSNIIEWKL